MSDLIRSRRRSARRSPQQDGFSLIELLVAVFVMAVGVLGVVGLQLLSLQNNRNALLRAEASRLAYDMMDRIRANADPDNGVDYAGVALGGDPPATGDCRAATCTVAQMETYDHAFWKCSLGNFNDNDVCTGLAVTGFLPEGDGSIVVDANGVYTITVQWQEANVAAASQISIESTR